MITDIRNTFSWIGLMVCLQLPAAVHGQGLPVGTPVLENYYRMQQLSGHVPDSLSFVIRPVSPGSPEQPDVFRPESNRQTGLVSFAGGDGLLKLLPVTWQQQTNTAYPYGWNDGGMIAARGYQQQFSAGLYARYRFLSIQLRPEWVYAANKHYEVFNKSEGDGVTALRWYRAIGNQIDMPEQFGTSSYNRMLPGQSSIRLTFDPVSVGLSTENLWWGPGRRNALLMSNSAAGFLHATLNTSRPVKTGIGSFEGQLMAGRLDDSGYPPTVDSLMDRFGKYSYREKINNPRYLSGLVLSYQPKWLPGLHLGLIRTAVMYQRDMTRNLRDLLPLFTPVARRTFTDPNGVLWENENPRLQYRSLFFRWVMPAGQFEVYGELGRNDPARNSRDRMVQADHSRAYVLGFTKLIPLSYRGDWLEVSAEATELAQTTSKQVRFSPTWYTHKYVRHGYTHRGQVLGAGIGPGSNVQSIHFSWNRGLKQAGLQLERFSHNEDFFNQHVSDVRRAWADLGFKAHTSWDYRQLLASAAVQYIQAYNYQYQFLMPDDARDFWDNEPQNKTNFSLQLALMYRF